MDKMPQIVVLNDGSKAWENEFEKLNVNPQNVILVYNKVDKLTDEEIQDLTKYPYDTCYIGAKSGKNIVQLKQMIRDKLENSY